MNNTLLSQSINKWAIGDPEVRYPPRWQRLQMADATCRIRCARSSDLPAPFLQRFFLFFIVQRAYKVSRLLHRQVRERVSPASKLGLVGVLVSEIVGVAGEKRRDED